MRTLIKPAHLLMLLPLLLSVSVLLWLRSNADIGVSQHTEFASEQVPAVSPVIDEQTDQDIPENVRNSVELQPEIPLNGYATIKPELLNWYENLPRPETESLYLEFDEAKRKLYSDKAKEDMAGFIKLVAYSPEDDPYLKWALQDAMSFRDRELLLEYLPLSSRIAQVAYWNGMHRNHQQAFSDAFDSWKTNDPENMPASLVLTAIEFDYEDSLAYAREFAVASDEALEVFEMLAIYQQPDLDLLAEEVWNSSQASFGDNSLFEAAIIAAKYAGNKEALFEIAHTLSRIPSSEYYQMRLSEFIRVADMPNLIDHVRYLSYYPDQRLWKRAE